VLESFGPPHDRTNPYLIELFASFPPEIDAHYFSWGRALRGDYDVFHVHWPEVMVRGRDPLRTVVRAGAFLLVLVRIRLGRRALVRTLHNARPHERPHRVQRSIIALCDRWTTVWITLSDGATAPPGAASVRAPIGRTPTEAGPPDAVVPGRIVHFGNIRPYKGVEQLLDAVSGLTDPGVTLQLFGACADPGLEQRILAAVRSDPRIRWEGRFVTDEELRDGLAEAQLVALPFTDVANSSSVLHALSAGRPVLTPRRPATVEVAEEVGPGWVHLYDGELDTEVLRDAVQAVAGGLPRTEPDLSARSWATIGQLHADAFRLAAQAVGRTD
jgi:beta-1,4-mannosyltransferase